MSAALGLILLQGIILIFLYATAFFIIITAMNSMLPKQPMLPFQRLRAMLAQKRRYRVLRFLLLVPKDETRLEELRALLGACGIQADAVMFTVCKRLLGALCTLLLTGALVMWKHQSAHATILLWTVLVSSSSLVLLRLDKVMLRTIREQRRARIVQDVQAISSQLLYYRESRLNVHVQLQRCLPLARYIRKEMQLLVNEWYEGSHEALQRFRKRLATDEAEEFADTLHVLHLHDSGYYYELLQERIRNYKDKLVLIRDGRKEAASYMLFLLAGVPILYTFIIFIYPWVAEARFLFNSLG